MKLRKIFILIAFAVTFFNGIDLQAQDVAVTLNVATAGTLSTLINSSNKNLITSLTLTGNLNGDDICFIREMAGSDVNGNATLGTLSVLDLSGANIVSGGGYYIYYSSYYYHTSDNLITDNMFYDCNKLTSITIPNSVTDIESDVFDGCTGLNQIMVDSNNSNLSSLDGVLFNKDRTSLIACPNGKTAQYTIPGSVTSIGSLAFIGCTGLTSIIIPNSVTSIEAGAFYGCKGLTSITIPSSVTSIEDGAFYDCTELAQIMVDSNNSNLSSLDGVLFNKDRTSLIACPNGKTAQYTIPGSVTSIGRLAFIGCTGLTSITIPNSVTSTESSAFYFCKGLTQIMVDSNNSNLSSLDGVLFNKDRTSLIVCPSGKAMQYTIPGCVTSIGDGAFAGCTELNSITMPNSVTSIGGSAFDGCTGLNSITIPGSVTSIENCAFWGCTGLNSITIPGSVTSIEDCTFRGCTGLTSVTIPSSVTSILDLSFSGCSGLTSVTLPNSVTYIEGDAFSGCTGLTSVTIGNSVTYIGYDAFSNCTGLTEIHCKMTTPITISSKVFTDVNKSTCKLYVPKGSYGSYSKANVWKDFTNIIEEGVTPVNEIKANNATVYAEHNGIVVKGANKGETISVYTTMGSLIQTIKATNDVRIYVPSNQIYLVRIAGKTFKVAL